MPRIAIKLSVELESGETYEVTADQRDLAALEVSDYGSAVHNRARYLAWNASRRVKRYTGTWEKFNTDECAEVISLDEEGPAADDDSLDPGRSDQNATV